MATLPNSSKAVQGSAHSVGKNGQAQLLPISPIGDQPTPGVVNYPVPAQLLSSLGPAPTNIAVVEAFLPYEIEQLPIEWQEAEKLLPALVDLFKARFLRECSNSAFLQCKFGLDYRYTTLLNSLQRLFRDIGETPTTEKDWILLTLLGTALQHSEIHFGALTFLFKYRYQCFEMPQLVAELNSHDLMEFYKHISAFSRPANVLRLTGELLNRYEVTTTNAFGIVNIINTMREEVSDTGLLRVLIQEFCSYDYLVFNGQHLENGGTTDLDIYGVFQHVWQVYYRKRLDSIRGLLIDRKQRLSSFFQQSAYLPAFVLANLPHIEPETVQLLVRGSSLRECTDLSISRSMRKILSKPEFLPSELSTNNQWLLYITLRSWGVAPLATVKVQQLLNALLSWGWEQDLSAKVFRRWKEEIRRAHKLGVFTSNELFYYVLHRYTERDSFSLKGRNRKSLERLYLAYQREWNYQQELEKIARFRFRSRKRPLRSIQNWVIPNTTDPDDCAYTFIALNSYKKLLSEGKKLRHCVGSYERKCAKGSTAIYSMRLKSSNDKALITVELENKQTIVQARGKYNRSITPPEHDALIKWAETNGFTINLF